MPRKKGAAGFAGLMDTVNQAGKKAKKKVTKTLKTAIGTPNTAEAPGGLRRFFRFSQLAVGEAGTSRKIEDIWATFLEELDDLGIPSEARSRMESLGFKKVLGKSGLGKGVTALVGGKENLALVKETRKLAMAAVTGITSPASSASLVKEWTGLLERLTDDPRFADENGKRVLSQLRKVDPKVMAKVGATQPFSILARRGEDPFYIRMFNKAMKRPDSPALPEGIVSALKQANEGKLPKVAASALKSLAPEGIAAGGVGRKLVGLLGKSGLGAAGVGVVAALEAHRAAGILGREGRAKKLAVHGFQGLGPTSSVDFLRDIVGKQEAVARRKVTMQRFEPELFQEVVRVLSDTGASGNTLTSTERRIGSDAQAGVSRRGRSGEDVQFLLDQLFNQMGQGG